jgi:hypothetical protein
MQKHQEHFRHNTDQQVFGSNLMHHRKYRVDQEEFCALIEQLELSWNFAKEIDQNAQ